MSNERDLYRKMVLSPKAGEEETDAVEELTALHSFSKAKSWSATRQMLEEGLRTKHASQNAKVEQFETKLSEAEKLFEEQLHAISTAEKN